MAVIIPSLLTASEQPRPGEGSCPRLGDVIAGGACGEQVRLWEGRRRPKPIS